MMTSSSDLDAASASPTDAETQQKIERKRERSRHYTHKSYGKVKARIHALRAELAAAEAQYHALLEQKRQEEEETATRDGSSELLDKYRQLAQLKQWLADENQALYRIKTEREIETARFEQVINRYQPPPLQETPVKFVPLPRESYRKPIEECKREALAFLARSNPLRSGVNVFGWTDRRHVTDGTLEFAFEKTFSNSTATELMQQTWSMLTNPATNTKIYSASMNARLRILQHIDDDTVLIYWHLRPAHVPVHFKTVYVLARVEIEGGYVLVFRTIHRDSLQLNDDGSGAVVNELEQPPRSTYWSFVNMWTVISNTGPGEAKYHFGGGSKAEMWAVELLLMCLRWETHVFGSRFLSPPSEELPASSTGSSESNAQPLAKIRA